jgi:hypothetical protein
MASLSILAGLCLLCLGRAALRKRLSATA